MPENPDDNSKMSDVCLIIVIINYKILIQDRIQEIWRYWNIENTKAAVGVQAQGD